MALETVVFPHNHHAANISLASFPETRPGQEKKSDPDLTNLPPPGNGGTRERRRRTRAAKNREAAESQRMTHIEVERNRRRQMNVYLAALRSLMPPSHVQRLDQASIIGGAIDYVKQLESLHQFLQVQARRSRVNVAGGGTPFAGFFSFPQHSSAGRAPPVPVNSSVADVEVNVVESHASVRVLTRRWPRQLLKLVAGLESLRLSTLHLNVTTADDVVLYSFSLKVEEECRLGSMDEIAGAVHHILMRIQEGLLDLY